MHVLAIDNVQFMFYIVILAIRNAFLWQSKTLFVYQIGCSPLRLIQCGIALLPSWTFLQHF